MNPFETISCAQAATEIRTVLSDLVLGPNVSSMLRDLDKCKGGCPGHVRGAVVQGAMACKSQDAEEIALLVLLN